ncbi:sulfite exporter TauE/SafE family protein [Butyrivibrio proteoclasticus]|uniref:sulfite exporter TauE/SafE family protein n=1 Tax=Butyrivibrio proteoclasticus TaxID=43305 RepID=UPI000479B3EA|nr:sulfite exporter TauE/SafE family protein [Butyrivibrio proteoclasticus]
MIYWIIATVLAFYIKGLCGFANTLVFQSILSFGNANVSISPVELVLGYPTNLIISFKERKHIDIKMVLTISLMVLSGSVVGVLFLKNADVSVIKIVFGVFVILLGIEMLLRDLSSKRAKNSRVLLTIIGVLAGLFCGLYGVGALLGAYIGRVTEDSKSFKANICAVFVIENTFRIVLYSIYGIITLESLKMSLSLAPFMLIGLLTGMFSAKVIDDKLVKKIVIVMLIISGIALIITNVA